MRVHAVVNQKAGSAVNLSPETLKDDIITQFRAAGHDINVDLVEPRDIENKLKACAGQSPDAIIVGGGDGTVRSAAQYLTGSEVALGILPLGTLNRLARDLEIPLDPAEAVKALATGHFRWIDVAEVNGKVFLNNSFIGIPSKISAERQKLRNETLHMRAGGYLRLLRDVLASRAKLRLTIGDGTEEKSLRVLSLAVSNNPYSEEPSLVLTRKSLETGELGLYISKHLSGLRLFGVLLRVACGRWENDPNLDRFTAKQIVMASHRRRLRASNDGEVEVLSTPLRYSIRPKALKVLVPGE